MLGNAGCTGGAEKLAVAWGVGYRNVHSETDFEARALRYVYGEWRDLERAIRSVMRENGAVIWAGACVGQHVSRCEDVSGVCPGRRAWRPAGAARHVARRHARFRDRFRDRFRIFRRVNASGAKSENRFVLNYFYSTPPPPHSGLGAAVSAPESEARCESSRPGIHVTSLDLWRGTSSRVRPDGFANGPAACPATPAASGPRPTRREPDTIHSPQYRRAKHALLATHHASRQPQPHTRVLRAQPNVHAQVVAMVDKDALEREVPFAEALDGHARAASLVGVQSRVVLAAAQLRTHILEAQAAET